METKSMVMRLQDRVESKVSRDMRRTAMKRKNQETVTKDTCKNRLKECSRFP